jgi:uncharacterized protein YraI
MPRFGFSRRLAALWTAGLLAVLLTSLPLTVVRAQALVSCAAPASALSGAYVTVNADQPQVNVRSGPNSYLYSKVGLLLTYESAPALGRSPGGDWIQIACPAASGGAGWVYAANVTITAQAELAIVEAPVTLTPVFTATVDPTLAAAFPALGATLTRLPTFTPAVPPTIPVFVDAPPPGLNDNWQASFIIIAGALGLAGLLLSFFLKR